MSTYIRYKYNVYEYGKLIGKDLRPMDAAKLADCDQTYVVQFAKSGSIYHGRFRFKISQTEKHHKPDKIIKSVTIDNKRVVMSDEWIDGWNSVRAAAQALRTGHGKITRRNGKKFTEVIM